MANNQQTTADTGEHAFVGLELLDDLIRQTFDGVAKEFKAKPKLGEWLKMLEVRAKLSPKDASHREMWKLLEEVRREVLDSDKPARKSTPSAVASRRTARRKKSRKND